MNSEAIYRVPKFNGDRETWPEFKFAFLNALELYEGLPDYVLQNVAEPSTPSAKSKWSQMKRKAYAVIAVSLEAAAAQHISHLGMGADADRDGYVAWKILLAFYEKKTVGNVIQLKMALFSVKMEPEEKAYQFAHRIGRFVGQLKMMDYATPDEDRVAVMIAGLSSKYEALVTSLDLDEKLTFEKLLENLENFENRAARNDAGASSGSAAFMATDLKKHSVPYKEYIKTVICNTCGGKGHKAKDCPTATVYANMAWNGDLPFSAPSVSSSLDY